MPPQNRAWLNDAHQTEQARPETCHPNHQGPVTSTQPETVGSSPQGDAELMTKKQVFDLEPAPGLEQVGDKGPKQVEDRNHRVG
jgi:hypothetical protein